MGTGALTARQARAARIAQPHNTHNASLTAGTT